MSAHSHDTAAGEHSNDTLAKRSLRSTTLLSWLMLAFAIGFFLLFLVQAGTFSGPNSPSQVKVPEKVTQEKVVVGKSSISGFDRDKQPYTISAQSAIQDPDKPNIIMLDAITGELRKSSGQRFTIDARDGVYDSDSKTLDLAGDVHIISVGRFVAAMPAARVTLTGKELTSRERVVVTFDAGDIVADGLKITDAGRNIQFLSRVKVRLRTAAKKENKDGDE